MLVAFVLALLVFGYISFGLGSGSVFGGARAFNLSPLEADSAMPGNMAGDGSYGDVPEDELPPESTLSYRDTTLSLEGQILGL